MATQKIKDISELEKAKLNENEPVIKFYIPKDHENPKINVNFKVYINLDAYKIKRGMVVSLPEHIFEVVAESIERRNEAEDTGTELVLIK